MLNSIIIRKMQIEPQGDTTLCHVEQLKFKGLAIPSVAKNGD